MFRGKRLFLEIRIAFGNTVAAGRTLAVLEVIKIDYEIVADAVGEFTDMMAAAGVQLAADDLLIAIEIVR